METIPGECILCRRTKSEGRGKVWPCSQVQSKFLRTLLYLTQDLALLPTGHLSASISLGFLLAIPLFYFLLRFNQNVVSSNSGGTAMCLLFAPPAMHLLLSWVFATLVDLAVFH